MSTDAIGGYFELEPSHPGTTDGERHPGLQRYQSGRAAFLALLQAHRPRRVWMPSYLCDSMLEPLRAAGVASARYAIDNTFAPLDLPLLAAGEWLLYVNYFGICDAQVDRLLRRYRAEQVVIDCTHAFYDPPREVLASIYSPRKFFGVPDGGYLATALPVPMPASEDEQSVSRMAHLHKRREQGAEAGYPDYQRAEASLEGQAPKRMSALTQSLLTGIDYEAARVRRRENFMQLHDALGAVNLLSPQLTPQAVPLSYPFLGAAPGMREVLRQQRIFVPRYWPEVLQDPTCRSGVEHRLAGECLPLPCDQRYGAQQMQRIIDVLSGAYLRAAVPHL